MAALYAVGYSPEELTDILFNMNFDYLIRDSYLPYIRLYGYFGMYEANRLEEFIEKLIRQKTHIKQCTFSQINMNLSIIATNLSYQRPAIFSKDITPEMVISKAVRMSISYPGIITPILHDEDYYGDGGEFMNYPIIMFEDLEETIGSKKCDKMIYFATFLRLFLRKIWGPWDPKPSKKLYKNISFYIVFSNGVTFASYNENPDGTLKRKIPIYNIYDYIRSLAFTMSRATYLYQITPKYLDRSIIVHIEEHIDSMQFQLTQLQKEYLFNEGIEAVQKQINKIINIF